MALVVHTNKEVPSATCRPPRNQLDPDPTSRGEKENAMKPRTYQMFAALVALALVLTACGGAVAPTAAAAPDKVSLQLKWATQAQFAGYYAALDQGYYKAQNLDV